MSSKQKVEFHLNQYSFTVSFDGTCLNILQTNTITKFMRKATLTSSIKSVGYTKELQVSDLYKLFMRHAEGTLPKEIYFSFLENGKNFLIEIRARSALGTDFDFVSSILLCEVTERQIKTEELANKIKFLKEKLEKLEKEISKEAVVSRQEENAKEQNVKKLHIPTGIPKCKLPKFAALKSKEQSNLSENELFMPANNTSKSSHIFNYELEQNLIPDVILGYISKLANEKNDNINEEYSEEFSGEEFSGEEFSGEEFVEYLLDNYLNSHC